MQRLAARLRIAGIVANTTGGVVIEVDTRNGDEAQRFVTALQSEAPLVAQIERCVLEEIDGGPAYSSFAIAASQWEPDSFTLISPDIALCHECRNEVMEPGGRRYGYAFTNCTNCGPRYSIITDIPYDRRNTTMAAFKMCEECASEYADASARRFHAEPIACPKCGPALASDSTSGEPLAEALAALERGEIVALKSLGGFQLACDALSGEAVNRLRDRKRRSRKPFAVMMRDVAEAALYCHVDRRERELLESKAAPIVLLRLREPCMLPDAIAPGLRELGVMLPYTPLHQLLFCGKLTSLVMTSGNVSEEPIMTSNDRARAALASIADVLLVHNRDIFTRVDDSVVRLDEGVTRVLRRARGYVPDSIEIGPGFAEVLACGGELKNTFCLTKGNYAILSQHIGDLENYETLEFYEETLRNLKHVYRANPLIIAHDLHPDYLTTIWAARQPQAKIAVQHHHAHIAACMGENGLREKVIGVAFDGTGYGTDGQVWGGEFLLCDFAGFERGAHLRYVPMIGGDRAVREGRRMAAAHLFDAFGAGYRQLGVPDPVTQLPIVFDRLLERPPLLTSSCGRLFDAVSSLTGICHTSSYEGEAAMLLEAAARTEDCGEYSYFVDMEGSPYTIDSRPMIRQIAQELAWGCDRGMIAARFHNTISAIIEAVCVRLRETTGLSRICLSGGAFQNNRLLRSTRSRLQGRMFQVFTHSRVPPNDGGLSLGQAVIAASLWARDGA